MDQSAPLPNQENLPLHERPWWKGYGARIMGGTAALALAVILVTSAISYTVLRDKSLEVAGLALSGQAATLGHDLETRVTHIINSANELAANPLLATALTDDIGRNVYLRDFMSGLSSIEGLKADIVMTDFRGNVLASNHPSIELRLPHDWIADSVDNSQSLGRIVMNNDTPYLLLSTPIIYRNTGTAEGALVYQIDLSAWLYSPIVQRVFQEAPWLSVLSLINPDTHSVKNGFVHAEGKPIINEGSPEIIKKVQLPSIVSGPPLAVHISASPSFITDPIRDLLRNVSVMSAIIFILALAASYLLSRRLTRKLKRLRTQAGLVHEAQFRNIVFTDEGRDEIDDLARAYTALFDELQRAYQQLEDESQREIEVRERHYKSIVNNSAEGIITISNAGTIETFNPSAERIFGYKAAEVLGQNVSVLMPLADRKAHDHYLMQSDMHAPRIINRSRELEGMRKSGETFPLELNVSPMTIGDQKKFIGIMRDISDRKEFEERINAARIEAEQANQAKSQFLSSMSHELRTPLNAILGFGQLLELNDKNPLNAQQTEAVDQILKGGEHLLELIDQVLNLAKIESGSMTMAIEPVELEPLLKDTLKMSEAMADKRNIAISREFPDDTPHVFVLADRTRLQQVLLNLLSNAVKYNVNGGRVCVSYRLDAKSNTCHVDVTDTGRGIADHLHDQVFAPFNRLGAEGSDVEGTGIGLTITRELVQMMDGDIGFVSKQGEGTTFWFELPIADGTARQQDKGAAVERTAPATNAQGVRTILYIEDNASNLQLMGMLLANREDLELVTAHTAELGLAKAKKDKPDLVLMDINLPGMNGIEAMRILRDSVATRQIPVIAVSANAMPREIEEAMKEGFVNYLTKPLDLSAALQAIDEAVYSDQAT